MSEKTLEFSMFADLKGITRDEWLKLRRHGIGGSDVAAILGLSKWKTPLDVYKDKIGEGPEDADNASMEWGRRLEPVIREAYADHVGLKVDKPELMFARPGFPFMLADLDGLRQDGRLVEIKTARTGADWGEEGTDEIPEYYLTQVQHYMAVMGAQACDVAVLIGASDFRIYTVYRDDELIEMLTNEEAKFWNEHVVPRIAPAPRSLTEVAQAFPKSSPLKVTADDATEAALRELVEVEREQAELKKKADELKAQVQHFMSYAEALTINGVTAATWKSSKPRVSFDTKSFSKAEPDLYKQYIKEGAPTRRFTIKTSFSESI